MSKTTAGLLIAIGAVVGGFAGGMIGNSLAVQGTTWAMVAQVAGVFGGAIIVAHIVL